MNYRVRSAAFREVPFNHLYTPKTVRAPGFMPGALFMPVVPFFASFPTAYEKTPAMIPGFQIMAEGTGFAPADPSKIGRFSGDCDRLLCHPSV